MSNLSIISAIAATAALTCVITSLLISRKMRRKVTYMLDALEDKEINFRFDEKRVFGRQFNRTLNRLRNIFDKERKEIIEQEKYFGLMLDHVKTGVAVIEENGQVALGGRDEGTFLKKSSLKLPQKTFKNKVLHSHNGYIIIFCIAFSLTELLATPLSFSRKRK